MSWHPHGIRTYTNSSGQGVVMMHFIMLHLTDLTEALLFGRKRSGSSPLSGSRNNRFASFNTTPISEAQRRLSSTRLVRSTGSGMTRDANRQSSGSKPLPSIAATERSLRRTISRRPSKPMGSKRRHFSLSSRYPICRPSFFRSSSLVSHQATPSRYPGDKARRIFRISVSRTEVGHCANAGNDLMGLTRPAF